MLGILWSANIYCHLARQHLTFPNNRREVSMIRVGIAGIGFMGMFHYLAYQRMRGIRVDAIYSGSAKKRAGDWRGIQGNFGPRGRKMELTGVRTYGRLEKLLNDPNIDLIDVTLPPYLHADTSIAAMKAGKHVFCEKPIALQVSDAQRMVLTASQLRRQLLIGHVLPFFPEYSWARQVIDSGKYGKLLGGSFRRVCSDPAWLKEYWNAKRVGGPMLDLHVHDAHFIRLLFGMPRVVSTHGRMRGQNAEFWQTTFGFANPKTFVSATSGTIDQQGRPFTHGFEIFLKNATLCFDFAVVKKTASYLCQPTLFGPDGRVTHPKLGDGDPLNAFRAQLSEVANSVRSGKTSSILGGKLARDALQLCHAQTKSLLTQRPVKVT